MTAFETWKWVRDYPYLAGVLNHSAFDHRGEPQPLGYPIISCSYGAMDTCGFPKTLYYIFQSLFKQEPMMYIFPHWNHEAGKTVKVLTVTNCDTCELFLNGKSLGVKECDLCTPCLWDIVYEPGTLSAVGYRNGKKEAEYEVKTAGVPYRLILEPHKQKIVNDSYDAVAVNVYAVDQNGVICPDADNLIRFHVSGGNILGVGNGNPNSHEKDFASERKLYHGKGQAIISCQLSAEELRIEAAAEGLLSDSVELEIENVAPEFELPASDSRIIDNWKVSSLATEEKPDPLMRIDWSENNAFYSVNMSSERLQEGLLPGWMFYRADVAIPNSAGKNVPIKFLLGAAVGLECEIWINGTKYFSGQYEKDDYFVNTEINFESNGAESFQISILLKTSGGKAGINGRDNEISIVCG